MNPTTAMIRRRGLLAACALAAFEFTALADS
mgnify:CR=1 FL=1